MVHTEIDNNNMDVSCLNTEPLCRGNDKGTAGALRTILALSAALYI
jgi:hypothetical protein